MKTAVERKDLSLTDFFLIYLQIGSAYKILVVRTLRYMTENLFKILELSLLELDQSYSL
jgi:hypothetical protein